MADMETAPGPVTEEEIKPQRVKINRGFTSERTWVSSQHQSVGQQITNDPLKKGLKRSTARSWCIALETRKELENRLKKLNSVVSRKRRNWATQQKPEVNKLELRSQLGRTWEK